MAIGKHTDRLLGLPWRDRGRGPREYDCLGLFLELARLSGFPLEDPLARGAESLRRFHRLFRRVDFKELRPLDLIVQRLARQHVVTVVDPGWVLDTNREAGAHRTPLRDVLEKASGAWRLRCTGS